MRAGTSHTVAVLVAGRGQGFLHAEDLGVGDLLELLPLAFRQNTVPLREEKRQNGADAAGVDPGRGSKAELAHLGCRIGERRDGFVHILIAREAAEAEPDGFHRVRRPKAHGGKDMRRFGQSGSAC